MREVRTLQPITYKGLGTISAEVILEGELETMGEVANHIALITFAAVQLESIAFVPADGHWSSGSCNETIEATYESGSSTLALECTFELERDVPRHTLEAIVTAKVMPPAQQAIGYYMSKKDHVVGAPVAGFSPVANSQRLFIDMNEVLSEQVGSAARARHATTQ